MTPPRPSPASRNTVRKILVAAPSDVSAARQVVLESIQDWNLANERRGVSLEVVRWEAAAGSGAADANAESILRKLAAQCELMVGVYWTRIGTAPGMPQGSLQAVEEFMARGKPVVLCLSTSPAPKDIDTGQYRTVLDFRARFQGPVLYFATTAELRQQFSRHLGGALENPRHAQRLAPAPSTPRPPGPESRSSR
jgi:hypothetical protein